MAEPVEPTALETIFADAAADWAPSATDLESWVTVDPALTAPDTDDTTVTLVGLFGGDLSGFLEACAAEETCDEADYAGLSGWAFGVEWTPEAARLRLRQAAAGAVNAVGFADREIHAAVNWSDDENVLSTDNEVVTDSFEGFWGELTTVDGPQYAVYFQDEADDVYYEVDSTSTVWAYF